MSGDISLSNAEQIGRSVTLFFDPEAIAARIDRPVRRKQELGGVHIRQQVRRRLRFRKRISSPGESPSSHNDRLRQGIVFARDPATESVIVGPRVESITFADRQGEPVSGTVPSVLEHGGEVSSVEQLREVRGKGPLWVRVSKRRPVDAGLPIRRRTILIAARPYMVPGLESSLARLPQLFGDIL